MEWHREKNQWHKCTSKIVSDSGESWEEDKTRRWDWWRGRMDRHEIRKHTSRTDIYIDTWVRRRSQEGINLAKFNLERFLVVSLANTTKWGVSCSSQSQKGQCGWIPVRKGEVRHKLGEVGGGHIMCAQRCNSWPVFWVSFFAQRETIGKLWAGKQSGLIWFLKSCSICLRRIICWSMENREELLLCPKLVVIPQSEWGSDRVRGKKN